MFRSPLVFCYQSVRNVTKHGARGGLLRRLSTYEARDDDEFLFPVHIINKDLAYFKWSAADISDVIDLDASSFSEMKTMIQTSKNLKIMKMEHRSHGTVTFTLIKNEQELWRVCNISIFGDVMTESSDLSKTIPDHKEFSQHFLHLINQESHEAPHVTLDHPYHYIFPPYALKTTDSIAMYLSLSRGAEATSGPTTFSEHESKAFHPRTLLASPTTSLREINISLCSESGNVVAVLDLLVLCQHGVENRISPGSGPTDRMIATNNCQSRVCSVMVVREEIREVGSE